MTGNSDQSEEKKRELLIEELLANGIYKTSDERHLYDAPMYVLEREYKTIPDKTNPESSTDWMT